MTLFAVKIKLDVSKIYKNFIARHESRYGMFDSRIPLRQPVSVVCVSPRAAQDASSNRRRGSRRGKKEFVRSWGEKSKREGAGAPRLPGASSTMRRGYYGAQVFLRGGPIGGPLSRDDCNTFGAAYNIGTRSPLPLLTPILSLSPFPPACLSARALLRVPEPTLEAAEQKRSRTRP